MQGKRLTFTLKQGGLSSLRATDVDLEASAEATRTAREKPEPVAIQHPIKKPPVLVLTDADIRHQGDVAPASAGAASAALAASAASAVEVTDWNRALAENGQSSEVTGTVRNNGKDLATSVRVTVRAFDEKGKLAGTVPATVSTSILPPGGTADFTAVFPDLHVIIAVKFDIQFEPVHMADDGMPTPQS